MNKLEELEKKNQENFEHLMNTILDYGLILGYKEEDEELNESETQLLEAIDEYVNSMINIEDCADANIH